VTGLFGDYNFTWVPIAITLAAVAAIPLLLMLLFRVVPLLSIDEIDEMDEIERGGAASTTAGPETASSEPSSDGGRLVGATGNARTVSATAVLMLGALLGILGIGSADPAEATTTPVAPEVSITGVEVGGLMQLSAKLTGPDRNPLPDTKVAFGFSTTQFGPPARLVPLGSVNTDKAGIARLTLGGDVDHLYKPTTNGPQEFVATYAAVGTEPVTTSTIVNVTVGQSAYQPGPPKPLAGVGNVLVVVLFTIVALIWMTLATQVWRIRRVCRGVPKPTANSV
jgi:hypothetical protein